MSRHAYWIAGLVFAALVLAKFSPVTGFTGLIRFGESWQERRLSAVRSLPLASVAASNGYDGQFYAQIALDPLLRSKELEQAIDVPGYRARRILLPAVAHLIGLGDTWWTLQAYALLNVCCWFALGRVLLRNLPQDDWLAFARWSGCLFSIGVLDSVRQSLVDLPALLLMALAVDAHVRSRFPKSAFWQALGALTKETSLIGSLALDCGPAVAQMRWKRTFWSLAAAGLPIALWSWFVHQRFSGSSGESGLGNFDWPLHGLLVQGRLSLRAVLNGDFDGRYSFGLFAVVGLFVQSWVLWRSPQVQSPWWRIGAVYSVLLVFLSSWVWSGYWAACRAVLPLTIAFNLLLPANRWFWPLWIAGNLTLIHGVWRFL